MINGLEGIPGSGKSYEACVYHVLPALQKGRKVITNLPLDIAMFKAIDSSFEDLIEIRTRPMPILGTWNAERVDENGNGNAFELFPVDIDNPLNFDDALLGEFYVDAREIPSESSLPKTDLKRSATVFAGPWDFYSTWKHPKTGIGPLIVVDECHVAMPKAGTDEHLIEWFKLHRHFNVDVLLLTQNFRDINSSIAGLLHVLVKCRKADILGRADHYIRKVHGGYRGAVISTEERKYRPEMFRLYKSHTQGNSVSESAASDVAPFIVQFNRLKWIFVAISVLACIWAFMPKSSPNTPKTGNMKRIMSDSKPVDTLPTVSPPQDTKIIEVNSIGKQPEKELVPKDLYPEPYGPKGLHITGYISNKIKGYYTVAVTEGMAVVTTVTSVDLIKVGYTVEPLSDCAAVIAFGSNKRTIVCDAPQPSLIPAMQGATTAKQLPVPEPLTLRKM